MPAKFPPTLATKVETTESSLVVHTRDGRHDVPWERCSPALANATSMERSQVRLSGGGYGIHWPLIDEDLAVGPLLDSL